ncbi:M14 family metallopeptidase [Flagellimonas algicola]|uniref:Peptidase M14 domain-containing protein n=1 Tax=Flagellimonas algicola TaxID=2583815 RepID=A0ABY2WMK0_9FLAO|nr:M14 family metallopeptidase [Allomuricauda algicola]TMU56108.1 hypothetical protein FGG15_00795 [Allomuricauda algicola]
MLTRYLLSLLCLVFLSQGCKQQNTDDVVFDTSFASARLADIEKTANNKFKANVLPESEPINPSPWYAFAVQAEDSKTVQLTLDYGEYQHRYVPKVSWDQLHWTSLDTAQFVLDTLNHTATLFLEVSSRKLYVAAQEIETSADTYAWMEKIVGEHPEIEQLVAGKTVLDKDNLALVHELTDVEDCIVLVARQHPPEIPGGTIGFKSFYETLFSNTEIAKAFRENFNIYTFPLLNPDGADMGNWRHNANGVDLNRDWIDFSQPETQMVKDFVEGKVKQGKKIRFALDFHTSHSGPYILVLDSINELKTAAIIPDWIKKIDSSFSAKVEVRRRSQELPYCYNYFFNVFGAESVTYEDGDETNRDTIRKRGQVYAEKLMQTLMTKQKNGAFSN